MTHEQAQGKLITPFTIVLTLLMTAGAVAAFFRFRDGLGATTNLSDRYPWGLWIGVDILSGVALAAGGFTTAALVHLFGGRKYETLVRPAILTALLGYLFVAVGLVVDLGIPWRIVHPIWMWPEQSAMFEVAWCVILYLMVLALEFAPAAIERFGWTALKPWWEKLSPVISIAALAFFVGIMSHSWIWAIAAGAFFAAGAVFVRGLVASRPGVPLLLIVAAVVFSTMHQSSLGALFLLMKDKLDPLWWTPLLPVNFLLSAVAVGFAMVIFEATLSAKAFRRPVEKELLAGMGTILAWALWIYLAVRLTDLAARDQLAAIFSGGKGSLFLWETIPGVLLPAVMLTCAKVRQSTGGLFLAATLAVLGLVFNRINVTWLGMNVPGEEVYFPSTVEIAITVSIVAAIVLFFSLAVKLFPVFSREDPTSDRQ